MSELQNALGIYLHLAIASEKRLRPLERDKMLVLAGVAAAEQGLATIAACCRQKIIAHNAGHLVSQYPTFSAALEDERFQNYLRQLRRGYSHEKLEHMLLSLGIVMAAEREAYYSDYEYAASLLGTTPSALDALYGEEGLHREGDDVRQSTLVPPETAEPPPSRPAVGLAGRVAAIWRWLSERLLVAMIAACLLALLALVVVVARQF